jgi:transcriptional regulator with XRE-family HTH domain
MTQAMHYVGKRIKKIRVEKRLTLKDMVEYTGLSLGYLSNLERDQTSPTLAALDNICTVLDIQMTDLLHVEVPKKVVSRRADRTPAEFPELLLFMDTIEFDQQNQTIQMITIKANELPEKTFWRHKYSEICVVVSGTLVVTIEKESYTLGAGDSISIEANERHAIQASDMQDCVSYWIHQKE